MPIKNSLKYIVKYWSICEYHFA